MQCLKCDSREFDVQTLPFTTEIDNKTFDIIVPAYVCSACETPLMDSKQMNEYLIKTREHLENTRKKK